MSQEQTNMHHVEAICLWGRDIPQNLMKLNRSTHMDLHKTMDIPRNIYSRMQRRAKMKTNHKILMNPQDIDIWKDMGRLFFENLHKLPLWLQRKHVENMMWQVDYDMKNYNILTWDKFDKPEWPKRKQTETFDMLYEHSIEAQKEIAKVLWKRLTTRQYAI